MIKEVGDAFEEVLLLEISSDTPEKIERYRKAVCDMILDESIDGHDVMVVIRDATPTQAETKGEHG
jgi:hypothetical protein